MSIFTKQLTVAGVMSAFHTTIDQLTTVADNNDAIVSNLQVEQEKLGETMAAARKEADSARSIKSKFMDIVQG
jgi:outer membrane murein-binding lipoprotein Lpp